MTARVALLLEVQNPVHRPQCFNLGAQHKVPAESSH